MSSFRDNTISCCYQCKERFPACHDSCETYQQERADWVEAKKQETRARSKDWSFDRYHYDRVQNSRKIGRAKGKVY